MAIQEKEKLKGLQTMFNQGYAIRSQLIQTIKSKYEKGTIFTIFLDTIDSFFCSS